MRIQKAYRKIAWTRGDTDGNVEESVYVGRWRLNQGFESCQVQGEQLLRVHLLLLTQPRSGESGSAGSPRSGAGSASAVSVGVRRRTVVGGSVRTYIQAISRVSLLRRKPFSTEGVKLLCIFYGYSAHWTERLASVTGIEVAIDSAVAIASAAAISKVAIPPTGTDNA